MSTPLSQLALLRRLTAILGAYVAGYSEPKGVDKVAMLQRLRQYYDTLCERISSQGGRVVNPAGGPYLSGTG